jgi:hypothetical protein
MVADNQVRERQSRCGPLNVRYRPPNDMARPLLAATTAGVALQPESPQAPGARSRRGGQQRESGQLQRLLRSGACFAAKARNRNQR